MCARNAHHYWLTSLNVKHEANLFHRSMHHKLTTTERQSPLFLAAAGSCIDGGKDIHASAKKGKSIGLCELWDLPPDDAHMRTY
jgi:hypothetical protein